MKLETETSPACCLNPMLPVCVCVSDGRPWNSCHQTVAINLGNTTERSRATLREWKVVFVIPIRKKNKYQCRVSLLLFCLI